MEYVLVTTGAARVRTCHVRDSKCRVPWVPGLWVEPSAEGVLAGDTLIGVGRAAIIAGTPVSCFEAVVGSDGKVACRMPPGIVAASEAMLRVMHQTACFAAISDPVLILGESGVGKDLLAQALHAASDRKDQPYVAVNLAALPNDLAEAELFGWVRGAFTGATDSRAGSFESAQGGTIFLDEVAEAPLPVQAKLLRAVESGFLCRLGSSKPVRMDARIVAATNREHAVREGALRLDLLERLACLILKVPPLRTRPQDIAPIASHVCAALDQRPSLDESAIETLCNYDWPGNVRELRNVIRRAAATCGGRVLTRAAVEDAIEIGRIHRAWFDGTMSACGVRDNRTQRIAASGLPRSTYYWRLKRGLLPA